MLGLHGSTRRAYSAGVLRSDAEVNVYLWIALSSVLQVELAEVCAKCERYIGTEGGGMDQSISFLAEEGTVRELGPLRGMNPVVASVCRY